MRGLLLVVAIPVSPIDCWSIEAPGICPGRSRSNRETRLPCSPIRAESVISTGTHAPGPFPSQSSGSGSGVMAAVLKSQWISTAPPGRNLPVNGETGVDPFNYQRLDQPGRPLHLLVAASMPLSVEVPGPVPISAASCWPAYSLSCKFSLLARGGSQVTAGPAGQFDAKDSGIQGAVVAVSSATECRSLEAAAECGEPARRGARRGLHWPRSGRAPHGRAPAGLKPAPQAQAASLASCGPATALDRPGPNAGLML